MRIFAREYDEFHYPETVNALSFPCTSRGILHDKPAWFIIVKDTQTPEKVGIGECSLIPGLSPDDRPEFEIRLGQIIDSLNQGNLKSSMHDFPDLALWPSIRFGVETALDDLNSGGHRRFLAGNFVGGKESIPINGLIWMGDRDFMYSQIREKLEAGWRCLKLKIGAIDFDAELDLISYLRGQFGPEELTIRVDANGAFPQAEALTKLQRLSEWALHSIEQPIRAGHWEDMARLCAESPLPIALDEELIGIYRKEDMASMLSAIMPQYIILKPSLLGGINASMDWIDVARQMGIDYWVTSALESNIGLNRIAQWTSGLQIKIPQGLGTGMLFQNNFESPLLVKPGELYHEPGRPWNLQALLTD